MVDGDKLLVVADKTIIKVAERNMQDVVPLYYNMKKALPHSLTNENIYDGLIHAFTGGNIGIYSNNISKIWNDEVFITGTDEEKQRALDCIKCLVCQNNFVIDYAKTLYKPEFPDHIKEEIQKYTNNNLPHFFKYAKDKEEYQIEKPNQSFVNKLDKIIQNPRINCRYTSNYGKKKKLGKPNYELMMSNPKIDFTIVMNENGKLLEGTNEVILKYNELVKKYYYKIDFALLENYSAQQVLTEKNRELIVYNQIIPEIKTELSQFGYTEEQVSDILVKYLYGFKESKYKNALWICYGDIILENMRKNLSVKYKEVQCIECGNWFITSIYNSKVCRCRSCQREYREKYKNQYNVKYYALNKN